MTRSYIPRLLYTSSAALKIVYCNAAWDRAAGNNGGSSILREGQKGHSCAARRQHRRGRSPALRPFYAPLYSCVLQGGEEVGCLYECPGPEISRSCHAHLAGRNVTGHGLCLVMGGDSRSDRCAKSQRPGIDRTPPTCGPKKHRLGESSTGRERLRCA
jgi:hypothetical protein